MNSETNFPYRLLISRYLKRDRARARQRASSHYKRLPSSKSHLFNQFLSYPREFGVPLKAAIRPIDDTPLTRSLRAWNHDRRRRIDIFILREKSSMLN